MPIARMVIGLGFGDEGKGSWVDHLVREHRVRVVVRFNGGAQALHHVVTERGEQHGFAQFGSGTLVPETRTVLSRFMLIEPEAMLHEAARLAALGVPDALQRTLVSERAPLIPPCNRLLNRIQEQYRGGARHGSSGFGIGLTQAAVDELGDEALYVRDIALGRCRDKFAALTERAMKIAEQFRSEATLPLIEQLHSINHRYYEELFERWHAAVRVVTDAELGTLLRSEDSVFEGAQGVLLDQYVGFFPYCTRSTCTFENAEHLLDEAEFDGTRERIGLLRAYGTRHGAGPFVTEDPSLHVPACHNQRNQWQGAFRTGWFDAVAARYALACVGRVDVLALTNLDRLSGSSDLKIAHRYGGGAEEFLECGQLVQVPRNYPLLRKRSEQLWHVRPEYAACAGWNRSFAKEGIERYLQTVEMLLQRPIQAYSQRADSQKVYR